MTNLYEPSYGQDKTWNFKADGTFFYIENNATNKYLTVGDNGTVFEATLIENNPKQMWLKGQSKLGEFLKGNESTYQTKEITYIFRPTLEI